jgi:hypothetical protein
MLRRFDFMPPTRESQFIRLQPAAFLPPASFGAPGWNLAVPCLREDGGP